MRRRKTSRRKPLRAALVVFIVLIVAAAILLTYALQRAAVTPRALGPYVEHRTQGHNPAIEKAGQTVAAMLTSLDRGNDDDPYVFPALKIGAQTATSASAAVAGTAIATTAGKPVYVASTAEAMRAIAQAKPGDVISFLPGTYRFEGQGSVKVTQPGTAEQRITVTAERAGTVTLEFNMVEGFRVAAPYWTFENLSIKGICENHSDCEHAFHVVGRASHFIARNNTITDFNAQFKINGEDGFMPDDGLIESNSLSNSSVRNTANPVTMMDMVAASRWVIRRNLITDFIKGDGNRVSYGAFAKGAGVDNRFEENIVICEHKLKGLPGSRVGLSFGGGGTGKEFCRDKRCITEHDRGVMQSNLIMACSDEGIYINRGATSKLIHNTLIDTSGIAVRFPESSADLEGNLVDGRTLARDGGIIRGDDNIESSVAALYIGRHSVRQLFAGASHLDLAWASPPPRRKAALPGILDLCGGPRSSQPVYGAFEDFSGCYQSSPAKVPLTVAR
ncbi:right-handed parallel beta-helix repeat-containing protein [Undibacterium sp.]|uniref:right-handed parallel beta-helix repeat-containing protein n=1 Tax=Undibacterium sp. TaxID=1914977 RepID=UPI00374D10F0